MGITKREKKIKYTDYLKIEIEEKTKLRDEYVKAIDDAENGKTVDYKHLLMLESVMYDHIITAWEKIDKIEFVEYLKRKTGDGK